MSSHFCLRRPAARRLRGLTLAGSLLAVLAAPDPALGQASRLGDTFAIPYIYAPVRRFPEIALDTVNGVYLTVSGNWYNGGAFVTADGVPVGSPFQIAPGQTAQTPSVAYSPDAGAFLVAWLDTNDQSSVWGQMLSYGAGGIANPVTGQFLIAAAPGGAFSESAPSIAYSATSREFLVAWMQGMTTQQWDIRAQRISNTGQLLGGEIPITVDGNWQTQPGIGYNPATDEYYVAWSAEAGGIASIDGQRVKAGTGALVGSRATLVTGPYLTLPKVQYNVATGKMFVVWYSEPPRGLYGRLINADGTFDGSIIPLNATYFAYDATHQAYNVLSNTFFVVTHAGMVDSPEDFGFEVSSLGVPSPAFQVTMAAGTGNFYPAIAAHTTRAEWMMITAHSMSTVAGQRVQTATRDPSGNPGQPPPPPPPPPPATYTLTVRLGLDGDAVVQVFAAGTALSLKIVPAEGTVFSGWDLSSAGDCLDGSLTMDADKTCIATFAPVIGGDDRALARSVDLSGDGAGDVFLYRRTTGEWWMAQNIPGGGFSYTQGKWSGQNLVVKASQLTDDSRSDLVLYDSATGQWRQALNNGSGGFTYGSGDWGPGWTVHIGRFNTDALDDVLVYKPTTGEWAITFSDGVGGFSAATTVLFNPPVWDISVADLNADGVSDLFLYNSASGEWWKGFNNGSGRFNWSEHGSWSPGWTVQGGDFNGDGRDDIFVYNADNGFWYVCTNTGGSAFAYHFGSWSPGWQLYVASLNGDDADDLLVYNPSIGYWYECFSDGRGGFTYYGSRFDTPSWDVSITDLDGDGLSDLFIYNTVTGQWRKGINVKGADPLGGGFGWSEQGTWSPGYAVIARR